MLSIPFWTCANDFFFTFCCSLFFSAPPSLSLLFSIFQSLSAIKLSQIHLLIKKFHRGKFFRNIYALSRYSAFVETVQLLSVPHSNSFLLFSPFIFISAFRQCISALSIHARIFGGKCSFSSYYFSFWIFLMLLVLHFWEHITKHIKTCRLTGIGVLCLLVVTLLTVFKEKLQKTVHTFIMGV